MHWVILLGGLELPRLERNHTFVALGIQLKQRTANGKIRRITHHNKRKIPSGNAKIGADCRLNLMASKACWASPDHDHITSFFSKFVNGLAISA